MPIRVTESKRRAIHSLASALSAEAALPDAGAEQYALPQQRRRVHWAILTGAGVVSLGLLGFWIVSAAELLGVHPPVGIPKAGISVGTALSAHDIFPGRAPVQGLELGCGDFNADGSQEIRLYDHDGTALRAIGGSASPQAQVALVPADGGPASISTPAFSLEDGQLLWDFDGDGRLDYIKSGLPNSKPTSVWDQSGKLLGSLPQDICRSACADMDGDGQPELIASDFNAPSRVCAYACGGRLLWQQTFSQPSFDLCVGDVDGDGRAELVVQEEINQSPFRVVRIYGWGQAPVTLSNWQGYGYPSACSDLDGDGRAEILVAGQGYFDCRSGSFTRLIYPAQFDHGINYEYIAALDIDGDGQKEICSAAHADRDTAILLFDLQGKCIHGEELGEDILQREVVTDAKKQQHLVVQTRSRVIVYP